MAKGAPLYTWQLEQQEEDNHLKKEFIKVNEKKLKLNKRFISPDELAYIKENYNLKNELLDEIINDSNKKFIEDNKANILKEFNDYLESNNKIIDDNEQEKISLEYHVGNYDFYKILKLDKLIEKHNRYIENSYRLIISNALNDKNRYIDNFERAKLKSYSQNPGSIDFLVEKHNQAFNKLFSKQIFTKFRNDLKSRNTIFTDEDIEKLKEQCYVDGRDFFEILGLKKHIISFNEKLYKEQYNNAFKILMKEYGSLSEPLSLDDLNDLKSKYPNFEWDGIVDNFNCQYFSRKYESNKTTDNVYYLYDYIPKGNWEFCDSDKVNISKQILQYKDGVSSAVSKFTQDLIIFIEEFANYELNSNIQKIFLVSIPSSTNSRDKNSSMKKSIEIIENKYDCGIIKLNNNQKIINLNDLLYRKIDIIPAHLSEKRPKYTDHIRTIGLNKNKLKNCDDGVFIILDDITTTGSIMDACEDILIHNGIRSDKIYKLVIAATD